MLTDHIINNYRLPPNSQDEKAFLSLGYEDGAVSTTVFDNHSDITIRRPCTPKLIIPILAAQGFCIDQNHIYAEHNKKGFKDRFSLGRVKEGDLEKAERWVEVANSRI